MATSPTLSRRVILLINFIWTKIILRELEDGRLDVPTFVSLAPRRA